MSTTPQRPTSAARGAWVWHVLQRIALIVLLVIALAALGEVLINAILFW